MNPGSVERAKLSLGTSSTAIYATVARILADRGRSNQNLLDVGCGTGQLHEFVKPHASKYCGADVVQYEAFPKSLEFIPVDLNATTWPVPADTYDAVVSAETIEHLENPRAFVRELVRIAKPNGLVVVTTPNNLSLLSKLTLLLKNKFNAFQDANYPAHITALVEIDLRRIFTECGLTEISVRYTNQGRLPGMARSWPSWLGFRGRRFSDNIAIAGLKATKGA